MGDFDEDRVLDLATANFGSNTTSILINTTILPPPPPPAGTTAIMILRGSNAVAAVMGQYEIYDLGNNAILAAYQLAQIGTDWRFNALGGVSGGNSTMLLRNANTGGFELYGLSRTTSSPLASWARSGSIGSSQASAILRASVSPT
jgi:hypothetical protein